MVENLNFEVEKKLRVYKKRTDLSEVNVFEKLKSDFKKRRFSWIGNYNDFALGYVSFASVLHADAGGIARPVGSFVIGETSSGKTEFLQALSKLLPEDRILNLTSVSAKSLFYNCRENAHYLNGKVVFVEELSGIKSEEIQYLLRILVTKGYAKHTTVLAGHAETIEIFGGISLQSTGLDEDMLRDDTMNRMVIFETDSSVEKRREVVNHIIGRYGSREITKNDEYGDYIDFFKGLRAYPVTIPFSSEIKPLMSCTDVSRRVKIFMDLLSAVVLINQKRRKVVDGALVAEWEDYEILKEITTVEKTKLSGKLKKSQKVVLLKIKLLEEFGAFTYQDILKLKPLNDAGEVYEVSSVKKIMKSLIELEFVEKVSSSRPSLFKVREYRVNRFEID